MAHLYNGDEIAKIALFIDNTLEDNSFSICKYKGRIYRVEENDAKDSYSSNVQKVKEDLSEKIKGLKNTFEMDFIYGKSTKGYQLLWFEAHILIFLLLYPSHNQTLISKIKNHKKYSFKEILLFYDELSDFLEDDRFKENGEWFDFEAKIIEDIPKLPKEEIDLKIKKMQNVTILKYLKEKIREKAIQAIDDGLEELIPEDVISKIPLISQLELCEWEEKLSDNTITVDDVDKIYSKDEIEPLTKEDFGNKNLKIDSFIHSGHFNGQTYDFAISSLYEFYNGSYDGENNSMYNKILTIFEYLASEIVEFDLAAVSITDYDILIKEMLKKSEQEEQELKEAKEKDEKLKKEKAKKREERKKQKEAKK